MEIYAACARATRPRWRRRTNSSSTSSSTPKRYDLSKVRPAQAELPVAIDEPPRAGVLTKRTCSRSSGTDRSQEWQGPDRRHRPPRQPRAAGRWASCSENQYRIGLVRMERAIKERMSLQEIETLCRTT